MTTNPANAIKDTMWAFLMDKRQKANIPVLKGYVYNLIQMTTQKTAGQEKYAAKGHVSWEELDMTLMSIVIEATALVLSGELDRIGESENAEADICRAALEKWGPQAQTAMVFEEMSELQKELCKNLRGADNRSHIAEEIADVEVMLKQMKLLHDCEQEVVEIRAQKLERLHKRIGEVN